MDLLYTLFHFIVAIGLLVAIHEFGHFWIARRCGVKVVRFSIGFGKIIWAYQKTADSTEYALSAIPLGGYVKMIDEREGDVKKEDLPFAFNRQPLAKRAAIVAAGPIFNLLLAIVLYWVIFVMGETGMRPIIGEVAPKTLAYQAGFAEGEEIISVNDKLTPTWNEAIGALFALAIGSEQGIKVVTKSRDGLEGTHFLDVPNEAAMEPELLYDRVGLKPFTPKLKPIIGRVLDDSAAKEAGLKPGDLILSADTIKIEQWMQWVHYVQQRPEIVIQLLISREGLHLPLTITPKRVETKDKILGRIGAGVHIDDALLDSFRVHYSLPVGEAFIAAVQQTYYYAFTSLKMMGKMLTGKASVDNLSGPISIAQYAGQSAEMGLIHFLKFLAIVSVSLGVLNLLPIPVLDGGHLMFYLIEGIKGSPVSENIQILFQQVGLFLLMSLMLFAVFLDVGRLF
ncbi:MAG: RIP metalloprotease RseP [Methylococcales bacterium]|nr:RIP metalloprotease RseP [Methylococcales bacterium]